MRKRLVLITANTDTLYQTSMIKVMSEQSSILGYDLIVLTHFVNYDDGGDYMKGDENIYSLIFQLKFDGAIVDLGSFYSRSLAKKLDDMLREKDIPVVSLDYLSGHFEDCMQNDRECFFVLTDHFIKKHGFNNIYCLSGPEGEIHSDERIKGYKDALIKNGLKIRQDHIFYGDFWLGKAVEFAEKIVSGELKKPQAIVCGSDYMALQLCLTLIKNGIRIPEEISIGGYDGNPDVNYYQPSLTSFSGAYLENAVKAVCHLHEMISGDNNYEVIKTMSYLRIGASCGCRESLANNADISQRMLDRAMRANIFMHSNYSSIMSNVKDISEFSEAMLRNMYLLDLSGDFFICLCDYMFDDINDAATELKNGYTNIMKCIVTHVNYKGDPTPKTFRLESIIPEEDIVSEPRTYYCTPLHYLDSSFGYCVRRYSSKEIVFEQFYGEFCQIAADSIKRIRMLEHEKHLNEKIQRLSERDILTGLFSRKGIINYMEKIDNDKEYFGVLYNIEEVEQTRRSQGEDYLKRVYVSFAQAVNLSCIRGEIAARISRDEFLIAGECDGSEFPGQLFINTLKSNIKMIEMHQDIQLLPMISHFTAVTDNITAPQKLISQLEQKLEESRDPQRFAGNVYMSIIRQLHNNIYEEPQLNWNASSEAAKMRLSQSYFQHIYKKFIEVSFNSDVISARIALAERLLVSTNLNVCEVAEKCGYTEQSYFMKLFKNKTGMTALEYKRKKIIGGK